MVGRLALILLLLLPAACGGPTTAPRTGFAPPVQGRTIFVVPFSTVMVPPEVEETVFDLLVDALNEKGAPLGFAFVILKEGAEPVDPAWLREQHYVTGEILGYIEDSGCCSTSIRLKGRARLHQPGSDRPTLEVEVPREVFFEHDYSTVEAERRRLAEDVASTLAGRLASALSSR